MNNNSLAQLKSIFARSWRWVLGLVLALLLISGLWGFLSQGTLKITTTPAPAQLVIGKDTSTIEATSEKRLSPGQYSVTIRKSGYLDYRTTVKVQTGQTTELKAVLLKTPTALLSAVRFPVLSTDNSSIYFLGGDSKLYRLTLGGAKQLLDTVTLPDPPRLEWSPDRSKIIFSAINRKFQLQQSGSPFYSAEDPDQAVVTWIYDLVSKKLTKLGPELASYTWSADSHNIFFVGASSPFSINRIGIDGSGLQKITEIKFNDVVINPSPDGKYLAWYAEPEGFGSSDIDLITLANGSQEIVTRDGYSVGAVWSPGSEHLLIDRVTATDFKHSLTILDLPSRNRRDLGLSAQAEQAIWSKSGDYLYGYSGTTRTIYKADLLNGQTADLVRFDKAAPANLQTTFDDSRLFYTVGDILYQLNLK